MSKRQYPSVVEMLTVMYGKFIAAIALIALLSLTLAACGSLPWKDDRAPIVSPNLLVKCPEFEVQVEQPVRVADVYAETRRLKDQHDDCRDRHNPLVDQLEAE